LEVLLTLTISFDGEAARTTADRGNELAESTRCGLSPGRNHHHEAVARTTLAVTDGGLERPAGAMLMMAAATAASVRRF
jgi:hypothetical protein